MNDKRPHLDSNMEATRARATANEPCPAWEDGQHFYFQQRDDIGRRYWKECSCGKTVERVK